MTEGTPLPAPDQPGSADPTPRRRRWPAVLLGMALGLLGVLALLPQLFGGLILGRVGGDALRADGVSGPLWSPALRGAQVTLPGLSVQAGQLGVRVAAVNPLTKTVRLNVQASGAAVNLKLAELFGGRGGGAAGGGWKVRLGRLDIRDTRLSVDGRQWNVPNGTFAVDNGEDGRLKVRGRTPGGDLNAEVQVSEGAAGNIFTADLDADARVLNHYWPGVTAGRIAGRYVFGDGPVRGDLTVSGAALRVPEAKFVTVTGIAGPLKHRGDRIDLKLSGRGWDGPVRATAAVDLKARRWTAVADATPTLRALAGALGTTGQGDLKLSVTAGGWSDVQVRAYARGAGQLAGIPFEGGRAVYTYRSAQGARPVSDLAFGAQTGLAGGDQTLQGRWALGQQGTATLRGDLAQKPLDVRADIDAQNLFRFSGRALGGPLSGSYALRGARIAAVLNPDFVAARARVALSGTPGDLRAVVTGGQAGPFALAGTAALDGRGLRADLVTGAGGTLRLDLDRQFRGSWQAQGASGGGITLDGQGRVDLTGGDLRGRLSARVPGVTQPLDGALDLNYVRQTGEFRAGAQRLVWRGQVFDVQARDLPVAGGLRVSGDLSVTNTLKMYGTLRAVGSGVDLSAVAQGGAADLRGTLRGVGVSAQTQLRAPYLTHARVQGADIQGTLSVDGGVRFALTTAGQTARGVIDGDRWNATGRVNLAALRPLVGLKDLSGTLDLNLAGRGGGARVNAAASGATVLGTLTRDGGPVTAALKVRAGGAEADVSGRVSPDVSLAGPLRWQGQTVQATLSGPYGDLRAQVDGRTAPLTLGGVSLPAQALRLSASVTPRLALAGTWGELRLAYDGAAGQVRVDGAQSLVAFGQAARVQGQATWAPGPAANGQPTWRGAVQARGTAERGTLTLAGPWDDLRVTLAEAGGLRAEGRASLPGASYDLRVRGGLSGSGLFVDGRVQGRGAEPHGALRVTDASGGLGLLRFRSLSDFTLDARSLSVAGLALSGQLSARNNLLDGTLRAGPLTLTARRGELRASGTLAGQAVEGSARLTLPGDLRDLRLRSFGRYHEVTAGGRLGALRGTLRLKPQTIGSGATRLTLPAQSFALSGSVTPPLVRVGGLTYDGGRWSGSLGARYALGDQPGTLSLVGAGERLLARPGGALAGEVTLLPELGGTLSASLAPLTPALPAEVRARLVPGRLTARLDPRGAALGLLGARYQGQPLALEGRVDWAGGLKGAATLTHPGSRLPLSYDGRDLRVRGAVLDARTLDAVLAGAGGRLALDLTVPALDPGRATGQAQVDVRAQGQGARGRVSLAGGQLSADLESDLGGRALRVRGPLYPRADAVLTWDDLRATLSGEAARTLTLRASGSVEGRALDLSATAQGLSGDRAAVRLSGTAAGAALNLALTRRAGAGLAGWQVAGGLSSADLRPLLGTPGRVTATLSGTLAEARAVAEGEVSGVAFRAPLAYVGGVLRVQGGNARLEQGQVQASGPLFPTLNLSAKATLTDLLPGQYTAQVGGTFARPDLNVQGQLSAGVGGLQAAGTRLSARLLGRDWVADLAGDALAGQMRGQLGSGALGGLLRADLRLSAAFRQGDTDLRLSGPLAWNTREGWAGRVRAVGDVPGGPLDAVLDGAGVLKLAANFGTGTRQARVTGTLPPGLPLRPAGTLDLAAFDLGALWGRADQLRATGRATLGGASWGAPEVAFAGRLDDAQGELTGDLGASYRAGDVSMRLLGQAVSGGATLKAGRYQATLRAGTADRPVRLARLLPLTLDVDGLTFAGQAEAGGTLSGGPERVTLRNVALKGQQEQAGPFSVYGSATYTPDTLETALSASLRGGVLTARGALPQGVTVRVERLNTEQVGAASLGRGEVSGQVILRGEARDPRLEGTLRAALDGLDAHVVVSGRVRDPRVGARLTLKGASSGTAYADLRDLDLKAGRVRARLYGTLTGGRENGGPDTRASFDLSGVWPELAGRVDATLAGLPTPLTLTGDGRGGYALNAGELGAGQLTLRRRPGFIPDLAGTLGLTPLPLVDGTGTARVEATLAGTLAAPTLAATLSTQGAAVGGVTLADTSGSLSATLSAGRSELRGVLAQGGAPVATLGGREVKLSGLKASAAGVDLAASGTATLDGTAALKLALSGALEGELDATYRARAIALKGSLDGPQALRATVDVSAAPLTGWRGEVRVTGGPTLTGTGAVLSRPAVLGVSGPYAYPQLSGEAGLLGAGARVVATARGAQVRLVDGPATRASGALEVRQDAAGSWVWLGAASLSRPELSLSVTPSGPLADPALLLSVRRGEWRASGTASLRAADLSVSDGVKDGRLTWQGDEVRADLPGLNLATLGLPGISGAVTASGAVSTRTRDGRLTLRVPNLLTPYEVPYLGLTLQGDVSGEVTARGGKLAVEASGALASGGGGGGTLKLSAQQAGALWTGRLSGQLQQEAGTLDVDVTAGPDAQGRPALGGSVTARAYPLSVAGQTLTLGGRIDLRGQTFEAALDAANTIGGATLDASGGVADLLPAIEGLLGVAPTGEGYRLRALLDELDLRSLKLAQDLGGRVNGEANIRDGGGTFVLRSADLKVGPKTLPARLEGTQVGGDWRIRGFLGDSDFTAGLSGGEVFGQGTLRALPLGAVVGAVAGTTPGEGVVTGVARFRFPLADPPAGTATVVAERIRVSATSSVDGQSVTETLIGSGSVDLAAREVRSVNVQLAGAGTWDVRGQYTREKVDLSAVFTDTTFTPVLGLLPGLAELGTSLKGTVRLSAAGTYDRPRGLLRAEGLRGTIAGLSVQLPTFSGDLPDSGAFTASGRLLTGGVVRSDGALDLRGQLTLGKLSGTVATFAGLLAPEALGALPNTTATLTQDGERWTVSAQSRSVNPVTGAGTLSLGGTLTPAWDLTLSARNYNLPLALISGRESALNADLRAVDDGTLIRVSGAADFARLVLGRVNAPTTIPAPGESTAAPSGNGRTTDNYVSPLAPEYTTFAKPAAPSDTAPADGAEPPKVTLPFLERLVLDDIPIRAPGGIRVDENLIRAEFAGDLLLSGTGARPRLSGGLRSQRGFVYLRENEFTLSDSRVTFGGDNLYPTFDITANGQVLAATTRQRVPVTLNLAGEFVTRAGGQTVLDLTTTLRCTVASEACRDPQSGLEYSEAELYALVATGVPNLSALPGNLGALGTSALQTALNVFVLGEVERTLATAFGLDVLRLTPQLSTEDGTLGATITLGSYLTRDLYLQYQVDLTGKGLIDATYSTPDNRFTFKVSTPLVGLNLQSLRPSFSAAYNVNPRTSLSLGVQSTEQTTKLRFGVSYRLFAR